MAGFLFGKVSWGAPPWLAWCFRKTGAFLHRCRAHPRATVITCVTILALIAGGMKSWLWWESHRPREFAYNPLRKVVVTVYQTPATIAPGAPDKDLLPSPWRIAFSGAPVALLEKIGKDAGEAVTLDPAVYQVVAELLLSHPPALDVVQEKPRMDVVGGTPVFTPGTPLFTVAADPLSARRFFVRSRQIVAVPRENDWQATRTTIDVSEAPPLAAPDSLPGGRGVFFVNVEPVRKRDDSTEQGIHSRLEEPTDAMSCVNRWYNYEGDDSMTDDGWAHGASGGACGEELRKPGVFSGVSART